MIPELDMHNGAAPKNAAEADKTLLVRFFYKMVTNEFKTREAGHAIFDELPYISIIIPGQRNSEFVSPVNETHKARFPEHYKRFLQQREQAPEGMPLEEWPMITRPMAEEYKFHNVHTVEQLAAIADTSLDKIGMGALELRKKARAFLETAKDTALVQRLAVERDEQNALIAQLQESNKQLEAGLEELRAEKKKKG